MSLGKGLFTQVKKQRTRNYQRRKTIELYIIMSYSQRKFLRKTTKRNQVKEINHHNTSFTRILHTGQIKDNEPFPERKRY